MAVILFFLKIALFALVAVLPVAYAWVSVLIRRRLQVRLGGLWGNGIFIVLLSIPLIYCAAGMLYVRQLSISDTKITTTHKVKSEGIFIEGIYAHDALFNDLNYPNGFAFYESRQPDGSLYRTNRHGNGESFVSLTSQYGFSISLPEAIASPLSVSVSIAKVWNLSTEERLAERKEYLFGGGLLGIFLELLCGGRYLTYEVNSGFEPWRAGSESDNFSSYPAWKKDIDFLKTVIEPRSK